jgi:hypothetical protein
MNEGFGRMWESLRRIVLLLGYETLTPKYE